MNYPAAAQALYCPAAAPGIDFDHHSPDSQANMRQILYNHTIRAICQMSKLMRTLSLGLVLLVSVLWGMPVLAQEDSAAQPATVPVVMPELLQRADNAAGASDHTQAVVDYSLFILLNPTFGPAYVSRALNYRAMGDTALAIEDLSAALEHTAPSPAYEAAVYYTRATLYLDQNNTRAALEDLNAAIAAYPQDIDSLSLRAQLLTFTEEYAAALEDYDRLVELQPDQAAHYMDRAFVNAQLGDLETALENYNQAVDLNPADAVPYAQRALFHAALSNFADALDDLNSAIDLNPANSRFYLLRGSVNTAADNPTDAAADYFQWLSLNVTREFVLPTALTSNQNFTVEMEQGWIYSIPFQVAAGQTVSVDARGVSQQQPIDPLLVILDAEGSPLVADDDSAGNLGAFIQDYLFDEEGEYTLIIGQAAGGVQQGDVVVQVSFGEVTEPSEDDD